VIESLERESRHHYVSRKMGSGRIGGGTVEGGLARGKGSQFPRLRFPENAHEVMLKNLQSRGKDNGGKRGTPGKGGAIMALDTGM